MRYSKQDDGTFLSKDQYPTTKGTLVVLLIGDTKFELCDAVTGTIVETKTIDTPNSIYLRRLAKNTLKKLMVESVFETETRVKKSSATPVVL